MRWCIGEPLAFAALCKLSTNRLRDCTQSTLVPVAELLKLQVPVLRKLDPPLARHLEKMDIPCFFAISWFITWFSHDVPLYPEVGIFPTVPDLCCICVVDLPIV